MKAAYKDANKFSWTKEELEAYDYAAMREQDERGRISFALKRAIQETQKNTTLTIATTMKAKGLDIQTIADSTGLSKEEIGNL